jgi:hypothetical protein
MDGFASFDHKLQFRNDLRLRIDCARSPRQARQAEFAEQRKTCARKGYNPGGTSYYVAVSFQLA